MAGRRQFELVQNCYCGHTPAEYDRPQRAVQTSSPLGNAAKGRAKGLRETDSILAEADVARRAADAAVGRLAADAVSVEGGGAPDALDLARSHEYHLLALLLGRTPSPDALAIVAGLGGDGTDLGLAHARLARAAAQAEPQIVAREYFDLFVGLGRGELLPYASYYLTGFLQERPLAKLRGDLAALGVRRSGDVSEPEDHIAILCEVMAGFANGTYPADLAAQRRFFDRHLRPWAPRFFADLETASAARFYRAVGAVGRLFIDIEAEAFAFAE